MTEEPVLLIRDGWEKQALAEVSEVLRPHLRAGRWDLVFFRALFDGAVCPFSEALSLLRPQAIVRPDARDGSDFATLPETWAEYRKALSKSMRDNLGYYPRLLTRDGFDWHVRTVQNPSDMPAAVARLTALHQARAQSLKGQRHCSHIHGPAQEKFLATLLGRLAEQNEAFISELVVDGEIVAAQAFVESGDQLMVYYSGYRDEWYKYSPIFVIDAVVFRTALERGVRRLNFLRNIGQWKTRWGAHSGAPLRRVALVPKRPDCLVRYGLFFLSQIYRKNVTERVPILRVKMERHVRKTLSGFKPKQDRFAQALFPLMPLVGRFGARLVPLAHFAARLPLHHR